jgi:hypothetical protein
VTETPRPNSPAASSGPSGQEVIEIRLRDLSQLFDSLDPSPFLEQDLDPKAAQYIIESFEELSPKPVGRIVLHVDRIPAGSDAAETVENAVHDHFARQARRFQRELGSLLRRGLVSLGIGLAFLAAVFVIEEQVVRVLGQTRLAPLLSQGLLIVGWVAMWRPLEIFLYDWWPILGRRRLYERLSAIPVWLEVSRATAL